MVRVKSKSSMLPVKLRKQLTQKENSDRKEVIAESKSYKNLKTDRRYQLLNPADQKIDSRMESHPHT
jgi:hypothetical protein